MSVFRTRTTKRLEDGSEKIYVGKTWRARAKDPISGERVEKAGFRTRTVGEAWKYAVERGEHRSVAPGAISPLLDEFRGHLQDKGTSAVQINLIIARVEKVLAVGGIVATTALTEDGVRRALALTYGSINADQTRKHYHAALRQFCRYMARRGRLPGNPMADIEPPKVRRVVHPRRVFAREEVSRMHSATRPGPAFRGLTGEQRDLVYTIALATGLRASEIAALRPSHLVLGRGRGHIHLPGTDTKNGEPAHIPLPAHLATRLSNYVQELGPEDRLFPGNWARHKEAGVMLRRDLETAEVPYETAEGFGDFHALRHTFITNLIRAGVAPKIVQTLTRHSTITLTLDRYTAVEQVELFDAINRPGFVQSLDASPSSLGTKGHQPATGLAADSGMDGTGESKESPDAAATCIDEHQLSAEEVGFEPTVGLHLHRFSRPALSTTQAPLRCRGWSG
jgi:integrase